MDELISFLGAHYTFFEQWGVALLILLAGMILFALVAACRRKIGWRARSLWLAAVIVCGAGLALTQFVVGYLQPLVVPAGYSHEEVRFAGAGMTIGGELLTPAGSGKSPAVVVLVGSDISSYRTNYARFANELITPVFSGLGYAILHVDKRGVGRSEGDWYTADFGNRADDTLAALSFLAKRPDIDPNRLAVLGHSQGGWIAQIMAARGPPVAFAISLAGPTVSVTEQILHDEVSSLVCEGIATPAAEAQAASTLAAIDASSRTAESGRYRQFHAIAEYRPDDALRSVKVPTLLLFGANDRLVPAAENLRRLAEIQGAAPSPLITTMTIDGVGHSLRTMDRCHSGSQADLPYPESIGSAMVSWIRQQD